MHIEAATVSFLVPYYNHNAYISQCLDSILRDSYPNKEIIIIDDGSTEPAVNLRAWLVEHEHDIRIVYKKRANKGVTKTLNEMIALASGDYFILLASDDYLINDTVSERVKILEENPDKLFLLSDAEVVDEHGDLIEDSNLFGLHHRQKSNYQSDNALMLEIILHWHVAGAVLMLNSEIFDVIGHYDEQIIAEDWDFYLRAAARNLILFHDKKVSAYRYHDASTCRKAEFQDRLNSDFCYVAKKNVVEFSFPFNLLLFCVAMAKDKTFAPYFRGKMGWFKKMIGK